jgi:hypothetical protein
VTNIQCSLERNKLSDIPDFSWETLMSDELKIKLDGNPCVEGNHNIYQNIDGTIDKYDLDEEIDLDELEEYYYEYEEENEEEGVKDGGKHKTEKKK